MENEIRDKILKGTQLAIDRLLEKKRRENSYVVISEIGKVVKVKAADIDNSSSTGTEASNFE